MLTRHDVIGLHNVFAQTEYGAILAENVRYERYKPTDVSNRQWVDLLGQDVNNLEHMRLTAGLVYDFMRSMDQLAPGRLDDDDRLLLPVGAVSHDWGEAIVTDITYSHKTPEDEQREKEAFLEIVTGSMEGVSGSELVVRAAHEVVFDQKRTRRGRMFNAVERVGYMRTALRAHVEVEGVTSPDLVNGLRWIAADVLGNQPMHLIEVAEEFPPVCQYLVRQQETISMAFDAVDDAVFANYDSTEEEAKRLAVAQSFALWHSWLDQQSAQRL